MLFRQLNYDIEHRGSVSALFFVRKVFYSPLNDYYMLTNHNNGWHEREIKHYTNFKLEIVL